MLYRFYLNIPNEEYLRFYRSESRSVQVKTDTGITLRFPAEHLRSYVTHEGIQGLFELEASDTDNRFVAIRRIA